MTLSKTLSWARLAVLVIPLFGLVSAAELACGETTANDVSKTPGADAGPANNNKNPGSPNNNNSSGGYDDYGGYGYGDDDGGYDNYGY